MSKVESPKSEPKQKVTGSRTGPGKKEQTDALYWLPLDRLSLDPAVMECIKLGLSCGKSVERTAKGVSEITGLDIQESKKLVMKAMTDAIALARKKKTCTYCGGDMNADGRFCRKCLREVGWENRPEPPMETEAVEEPGPAIDEEPEPVCTLVTISVESTTRYGGGYDPERNERMEPPFNIEHKEQAAKNLVDGFNTGSLIVHDPDYERYCAKGWSIYNGTNEATIFVPCSNDMILLFRMKQNERSVNRIEYGAPPLGIVRFFNIKNVELEGSVLRAYSTDPDNSFSFNLDPVDRPAHPEDCIEDGATAVKLLIDGFRRGKIDGWSEQGENVKLTIACFGGYVDFTMRREDHKKNRVSIHRYDASYTICNIVRMNKSGDYVEMSDCSVGSKSSYKPENRITFRINKKPSG
ncbi:hypothetical protein Mpt1_c12950 [Candidatus Methanoplasma termitum]|uniref:Uncharacterized protein n=1 Tax=Candidatus Methanoplasma termitum TaxID=1577791 RepID=A0A0A7LFW9_9ARCH|nr:hypothetical protein [Candidatus Methanoplasma termitum]AIZ57157.1 hypothetical protein Mpt1_c12950 [Candidatus Methanoplasma termitum]MCL2334374.1 hypothetical protein [Candidatus Methanoplasma sp.]